MKKGCGLCKQYGHGCQYHPDGPVDRGDGKGKLGSGLCGLPKRNRDPCRNNAGKGTQHVGRGPCWLHGGRLPTVTKKYQRVKAEEELVRYGLPRQVDPQQALLEEIARTAGHVAWLELKVQEQKKDEDLTWGLTKEVIGGKDAGITLESKPSVWLQLYHKERHHLVDVCRVAIAAGIAEREVKIAERQGQLIAQTIRGVLKDLGVREDRQTATVVRRHLTLVAAPENES